MEKQNQQIVQEKTERKPTIKTNWKFIAIVVAFAVLVGGGAVFILLQILQPQFSQPQLLPKYPKQYILQIFPQDQSCTVDSDCVIVGTECGDCACGAPINKLNQAKYERQYEELCRDYRGGFCDFLCETPFARCVHNKCVLSSLPSKADLTKDWQTYRNEEFGFEVRYPAAEWEVLPVEQYNVVAELVPPSYAAKPEWSPTSIVITSIPIQEGQSAEEMLLDRLRLSEGYGIKPSMESFTVKEIGGTSFYFTSTGPFEGDYSVGYYAIGKDKVIIFGLGSRTGMNDSDRLEDEPDHLVLKRMLATFRFVEVGVDN